MTAPTRTLLSFVFLAAGLAGVGSFQSLQTASVAPAAQSTRSQAQRFAEKFTVVGQRIKAKAHIIQRVHEGGLDLWEAAAWFRRLNETPAHSPDRGWQRLPGRCDGEKLCRQVLCWLASHTRDKLSPSQRFARLQELEEELERHIARHGKVQLPEL